MRSKGRVVAAFLLFLGAVLLGIPVGAASEGGAGLPLYLVQLQEYTAAREPRLFTYQIRPGDTLYSIALEFGTDIETLAGLNNIGNPHLIFAGETIEVLTLVGSVHRVAEGETVEKIAELYGVEAEAILEANRLSGDRLLPRGERIIVPGGRLSRSGTVVFSWPLQGRLTSGYGWRNGKFHYGIDIGAPHGTPFYAAADGRVSKAQYWGSYGLMVELDHGYGWSSRYGHASKLAVTPGQRVSSGQVIGYIGVTGNTTGPHLHFEILKDGQKINPQSQLP